MMIEVIGIRRLAGFKLELEFSDGTVGTRDFESLLQRTGPMIAPLKDPEYFGRVFLEDGALTWPNGYDWDPAALHYCGSRTLPSSYEQSLTRTDVRQLFFAILDFID